MTTCRLFEMLCKVIVVRLSRGAFIFSNLIFDLTHYLQSHDMLYVVLIIMLFILPRLFVRFGIPVGLGAFFLGYISANQFMIFSNDQIIPIFSTLGISSLFLYAGLEIDFNDLKANARHLVQHILVLSGILVLFTFGLSTLFGFTPAVSAIVSLALLTPSTGFILDTLPSTGLNSEQKTWVKNMAIAAEVLALLLLLIFQSKSVLNASISLGTILVLAIVLPFLFHWVAKRTSKKTPGADFSFLLLLAVAAGTLTKKMGAYYLVGAFLVGITVNFYEKNIAKDPKEEFETAARFFSAFFMPFYFFNAGLKLDSSIMSLDALWIGLGFIVLALPIRLGSVVLHRKFSIDEESKESLPIAISLLPTLVFGLVLVEILKQFSPSLPPALIGGVLVYTVVITIVPNFILKFVLRRTDLVEVAQTTFIGNPGELPNRGPTKSQIPTKY